MEKDMQEFTARPYQIDLFEIARKQNIIIYLPTGSGKTYIAVLLIKELSADIREPYSKGGKRTVFIVNKVPLVIQQGEYIARLTGLSCGLYSGDVLPDFWTDETWASELENKQVLVMTAQILVNCLIHGYMKLNRINLIIFDECHNAVHGHPMRQIMQRFETCPIQEQPRVLAMSASLLNANVNFEKIEAVIQTLEVTFHAKIATVNSLVPVQHYYATPKETIVQFDTYSMPEEQEQIHETINEIIIILNSIVLKNTLKNIESSVEFRPPSMNKKLQSILMDIQEHFLLTGIYGTSKCILLHLIQLECLKKYTDDVETAYVFEYVIIELTKLRKILENIMEKETEVNKIHKYSSDQVRKLFTVLKDFYMKKLENQKFCCIVFVQKRFTAKVLYHLLKNLQEHDTEYEFLKPDFIIGFNVNPFNSPREVMCMSKWNKEALHRFKNGLSNCFVATDVVDEGIDIPICTLVVRFNFPMDVRAYIQSKGRARFATSQYTLLVPNGDTTYLSRYNNFKKTESHLKEILVGRSEYRVKPTESKIKNELYKYDIEPYRVIANDGTECCITANTAIDIICRYSALLLNCKFINLSPIWKLYQFEGDVQSNSKIYQVSIKLPIVSPLKSVIYGEPMQNISTAKQSAAMNMCIELHKIGELSDKLMPNTMTNLEHNLDYLFPNWVDEDKSETAIIGTYKKKRHHQLQFPSALYGAYPRPNKPVYLHVLHAKPTYPMPHNDNRYLVFYNLLCDNAGFAILSSSKMPPVPSFPIFMNVGELNVDVKINHKTVNLSKEEIESVKVFHTLIFSEIVPVIKSFMVFDNCNLDNCFLIAPVDKNWDINWDVIREYEYVERIQPPVPFHFKRKDYELALVIPNYRASADIYIVTEVCDYLTPNSCFPTDDFFTYVHYYKQKHGLVVNDLKQPMLEVKQISRKINCIKPRHMHSESKKNKRAETLEDLKEHLIPELCTIIKFPALYHLKTTMLPSILHRISQLLIAEDLRFTIAEETKLGPLHLFDDPNWPGLVITDKERNELPEPLLENSMEDSLENSQPETEISGPEIDVLNTEASHYPWAKDQEPPDLDRNIEEIQLIQVEHYCQFMSTVCNSETSTVTTKQAGFMSVSQIKGPSLRILSLKNSSGPDPVQIMYALTSKMGHDAFDLERLEILGDSYLKFITSLYLYSTFSHYSEGRLTALKGKIIGNRHLYYCGVKKNIPGRMKVDDFIPLSNFSAPAYTAFRQLQTILLDAEVSPNVLYEIEIPRKEQFTGFISNATKCVMEAKVLNWDTTESQTGMEHYLGRQTVSDKTVADCVEALIGVYLTSMGIKDAVTLLKWFQILPNEFDVEKLLYSILENPVISPGNVDHFMPWASDIEAKIGYKFKNRAYLLQAFTHPSYSANNITECYQRLEFLGDAILDFLITCYIYENCGNLNPGAVTDLRSALVNNITFACLAVRYGLHTALLAYSPQLNDAIYRFVKFQEERNHVVNDEILWILLEEEECKMAEYVDVPKVLGDLFETIVGAIYLDSGKDLIKVWEMIYALMHKEIDEFSKNVPKQPIRVLYETQGARPQFSHAVRIDGTTNVMVPLRVIIAGKVKTFHGFGPNKKQAKCAAAKHALKSLLHKA